MQQPLSEVEPRFQPKVTADEAGAEASLHKSIREDVSLLIGRSGGNLQSLRYVGVYETRILEA